MDMPKTVDDWYNFAKGVKELDSGNIPIATDSWSNAFNMSAAWGLYLNRMDGFYPDPETDKVSHHFSDPRYKDYLSWLNKLYKEELLDQEFATNTREIHYQNLPKVGISLGYGPNGLNTALKTAQVTRDQAFFLVMPYVIGEDGHQKVAVSMSSLAWEHAITAQCKMKKLQLNGLIG